METFYPEKTRVSCPSRAENTPTRYKSPKVGFPGLGSRKFTSWRAKSQVGAPSPDLARANWEVGAPKSGLGAPTCDLARAKCPPTHQTIDLHTIVVTGNSVPHLPLHTWHEESIVPSFFD